MGNSSAMNPRKHLKSHETTGSITIQRLVIVTCLLSLAAGFNLLLFIFHEREEAVQTVRASRLAEEGLSQTVTAVQAVGVVGLATPADDYFEPDRTGQRYWRRIRISPGCVPGERDHIIVMVGWKTIVGEKQVSLLGVLEEPKTTQVAIGMER